MKIYLMRHAIAVLRGSTGFAQDSDRPLTDDGRKKLEAVCLGLKHLEPDWKAIITSPYLRARQTGDIVGAMFDSPHLIQEADALEPGHTTKQLVAFLSELKNLSSILLVGHEPSLSEHLANFLFGASHGGFQFKKAGIACVEFDEAITSGEGTLLWMMTPNQMMRLGKKKKA